MFFTEISGIGFNGQCKTQIADCRLQTESKMQDRGKMQTEHKL